MNIGNITKFVKNNIGSSDDFGSVKAGREEAARVDTELGRINQDVVDVSGKLDSLREDSKLTPPTFKDVSNKQLILGTASAGAFLGGAAGILNGMSSGGLQLTHTEVPIYEESLNGVGFNTGLVDHVTTGAGVPGYDVGEFTRRANTREQVGSYTKTEGSVGGSNMFVSGLAGAALGAATGAAVGGGIALLRKAVGQEHNGTAARETEGDMKLMIAGGVAGAAVGGAAGALSTMLSAGEHTYTTEVAPNMETKVLGQMPGPGGFFVPESETNGRPTSENIADWIGDSDRSLSRRGFLGSFNDRRDIKGEVPERNLLGQVKVGEETKTVDAGSSMATNVLGGMAVGAVTGVAGGVLVNVLRKTL